MAEAHDDDQWVVNVGPLEVVLRPSLGSGAFGTVYKATKNNGAEKYAVKEIPLRDPTGMNTKLYQMAQDEIGTMMKLQSHPNIVKVVENFTKRNSLWIVMEMCDGDLRKYLEENENLSLFQQTDLMHQSASALSFMHSQSPPIVHRDIKLHNILTTKKKEKLVLKICDFGFAKFYDDKRGTSYSAAFKHNPICLLYTSPSPRDS